MKLLAISGSTRAKSTNTALLHALAETAPEDVHIAVFDGLGRLPVFSQDLEGDNTPAVVNEFCGQLNRADGLIISSPEYVRTMPGGLKNAIDWLVSRDEIVHKPTVLAHASHRGDDMLETLRSVMRTVTTQFDEQNFLRMPIMSLSPADAMRVLREPGNRQAIREFIDSFADFVEAAKLESDQAE